MSILVLTSDTLIGTPATGNIEYSSPIFAATPIGTQRGIVPTQQYYRLDSNLAGANSTSAQNIFGVGVTLSASTVYEYEFLIALAKTAGTTSHSVAFVFAGTATLNNGIATYIYTNFGNTIPNGGAANVATTSTISSAVTLFSSLTTANQSLLLICKGTVSINAGGTFIPQYTLSAAPGGAYSTVAGSYIRIAPIGASGSAINVGTWA